MSIDTYENLKASIISWSHRDDMDLLIDDFIDLAEAEMYNNPSETLQLRGGEARVAFATNATDRFAALPTGYKSSRKLRIQIVNGESVELRFRTPSQLNILSTTGLPQFFTVTDQIEFNRVSDQVYAGEIQYFQDFTPLSDTATTNFILTSDPNIYLFGALWALNVHTKQPQSAAEHYQRFIGAIQGANRVANEGRYGPAPVMRIEGATP